MRRALRPAARNALASGLHRAATLVLDERGMIRDCCTAAEQLFGYSLRMLITQHISNLFPQLAGIELLHDGHVSPLLEDLCQDGHVFLAHSRHRGLLPCELSLVSLEESGKRLLKLFVVPAGDPVADLRA